MKAYKKLNQIAFTQGGLFTAKQAEASGYMYGFIVYWLDFRANPLKQGVDPMFCLLVIVQFYVFLGLPIA